MQTALITTLLVVSSASCAWAGGADYFFWMSDSTKVLGLNIQQKLRNEPNLVIAPFGLHTILSLTLRGARGNTTSELLALLNWQSYNPSDLFFIYTRVFVEGWNGNGNANAIMVGQNVTLNPSFLEEAKKFYQALVISGDPKNPEKAETEINEFVANRTNGHIQTIIPRGSVTNESSLILASSFNYQEYWQLKFDPSKTQKQSFYKNDGTIVKVDMMKDTRVILYKKDNRLGVDAIQIPLSTTDKYQILIVVPHQRNGLSELENLLSDPGEKFRLFGGMVPKMVELTLPKFKVETKLDLKDTMKQLGMVKAFTPNMADFRGFDELGWGSTMWQRPFTTSFQNLQGANTDTLNLNVPESSMPLSPDNLYISNVYHSVTLEINESGLNTDSSPDTPVQATPSNLNNSDSSPFRARVVADRPFMFFIGGFDSYPWIKLQGRFSGF